LLGGVSTLISSDIKEKKSMVSKYVGRRKKEYLDEGEGIPS
jgi:hypothetical protein